MGIMDRIRNIGRRDGQDPELAQAMRGTGQFAGQQFTPGYAGANRPQPDTQGPDLNLISESPVQTEGETEARRAGTIMGIGEFLKRNGVQPTRDQLEGNRAMSRERIRDAAVTLMRYKEGKTSVDNRVIRAQEWWKLRNWDMIREARGTKGIQERKGSTAWLWNCIVGKHADFMDSYPEPVILPRAQDDKDEAKALSEIIPVVLKMNGYKKVYSNNSWQKLIEGTGVRGVFWDAQKLNGIGDISIKKINILNLFWEPGVQNIQESKNLFYVNEVDNETLVQQYPQLKGKLNSNAMLTLQYRTDDYVDRSDKSAVVDWYYFHWEGQKKTLQYCKFVNDQVLFSSEDDPEMALNGLYADARYPFVLDPLFPVEGSPAGYGYVDIGKDAQMDIDTLNQAMVLNAVGNATPRHFIKKDGSVNEKEFADLSKPFVHVNGALGEDSIRQIPNMVMGSEAFNMLTQKIDELKFVTGNTDVNNGGVPSGVTAASAIAALKEDSGRSSKDQIGSSYEADMEVTDMVVERIRQFYSLSRQFRIIGESGQEEFRTYSNAGIRPQPMPGGLGLEEGMRLPVFDIDIRAQRENAYTRMSQNELALDLMNRGFFSPQNADVALMALDMMDFKGKDELVGKIQKNAQMLATIQKLAQVAMALAQQTGNQQIAQEVGMVMQGVVMEAGGGGAALPAGGGQANGIQAMKTADASAKEQDPNENKIVSRARERAANASRPD